MKYFAYTSQVNLPTQSRSGLGRCSFEETEGSMVLSLNGALSSGRGLTVVLVDFVHCEFSVNPLSNVYSLAPREHL